MSDQRSFLIAARLATTTALTMFGLIVVGGIVRTTGSGLACPDWPLCHGQLIPPFQFNVLIEWFHRLLALVVSVMLAVTVGWIAFRRPLRLRLGGLGALAVGLLGVQVLLGALTVWKLLHPAVVGSHLAVALLLFSSVVVIAMAARAEAAADEPVRRGPYGFVMRPPGLLPIAALGVVAIYAQAVMGGVVSTHHASLVCPDWPTCNGEWFPAMTGLVGLQMAHRFGAYAVVGIVFGLLVLVRRVGEPGVTRHAGVLVALTLVQVVLGVLNVFMRTPVWLSAMHLGTAALMLALAIVLTFRVAAIPAGARVLAAEAR